MSPAFENGIIGVRNWEYVKYRYFDHPRGISGEFKRLFLSDAHEISAQLSFSKNMISVI